MPNHVSTILKVYGPAESVKEFVNKTLNDGYVLIVNHLPVPKELTDVPADGTYRPDLVEKYGYSDWYGWCNANWGTKWGDYDDGEWHFFEDGAEIAYNTAWSPMTEFYLTISENWPQLVFYHEFSDEGGRFVGSETISNGEVIEELNLEWNSDEGIEMRERLGHYCPEDEEYTDDESE